MSAKPSHRWLKPTAFVTSFVLTIGGVFLGQSLLAPPAEAAPIQGSAASFNTAGWRYVSGTTPVTLGATTSATSATVPFAPIDREHLYGSSYNNGGTVWYLTNTVDPNGGNQVAIGFGKNASDVMSNPLSTIAIDADPYGTRGVRTAYLWAWDSAGPPTTAQNGGQTVPPNTSAIVRWTEGSTDGQFILIPDPNYGTFNTQRAGTAYSYWSAGEVIQRTGEIFLGGGECSGINNSYAMMIFNPVTYDYNFSGTLKPLTPKDNIFGTGDGCTGNGSVKSDFALDANGNAYLLVGSTQAAESFNLPAAARLWLVRVVPGKAGADWTYELVTPIQAAPGQRAGVTTFATGGSYGYGSAFFNGMLYTAVYQDGQFLARTNPMSGLAYDAGNFGPVQPYVQDLASGQTAQVLEGTVWNDANANGQIESSEVGAPNVTVALYLKNTAGSYVLQGLRQTNASGNYSFLLGGDGDYIVRVVQPQINGVNAVQTWATGDTQTVGTTSSASITAVCGATGNITSPAGASCTGANPMPFVDPPVPTATSALGTDTSTQPPAMAIYSTISIRGDQIVGDASFGITARGSFGDSQIGPATLPTAPVHINGLDADRLYLGAANGQIYTGPATDNAAHNATDDGVTIKSTLGTIPLNGTMLAGTKNYTLTAPVNGTDAASTLVNVSGWSTAVNGASWVTTPAWSPGILGGVAEGGFTPVSSGTGLGATGQPMSFRAQVAETPTTLPTNSSYQYQGNPGTNTTPWATPGEIEDYRFNVAASVYRVAAKTTGTGTGNFTVDGQNLQNVGPALVFGAAAGAAGGTAKSITAQIPTNWNVTNVQLCDTVLGCSVDMTSKNFSWTKTATAATINFTPALGDDLTVVVTYSKGADASKSTLSVTPETQVIGKPATATVTVKDVDGSLLSGITATVTVPDTTSATVTGDSGVAGKTATCVTGPAGTCTVKVNDAAAEPVPVSAFVPVNGVSTEVSNSPISVTFTPDPTTPVEPSARLLVDPQDQSTVIPSPGATKSLTTKMETVTITPKVDIVFVLDMSVSGQQHATQIAQGLGQFIKNINDAGGVDVAIGIYAFGDLTCNSPTTGQPDVFKWVTPVTPLSSTYTVADVQNTLNNGLPHNNGCDTAEDQIYAGYTAAATAAWRDGAQRELVLVTDIGSKTRTDTKYYVNGQAPTLANWVAYSNANSIHTTIINSSGFQYPEQNTDVKPGDPGYTSWAQIATAFGSDTTAWPYTSDQYVTTMTNAIVYGDGTTTVTIVPSVTIKYNDGTTSTDVTATLNPSGATVVGPDWTSFTLTATAKPLDQLVRLKDTTTVTATYTDQATGKIVARQVITFNAPDPNPVCEPGKTGTNLSANPLSLAVGGTSNITAHITDANCDPMADVPVTFSIPATSSGTLTVVNGTTDANGDAKATLQDTKAEPVDVSAKLVSTDIHNSPVTVTFVGGPPNTGKSELALSPAGPVQVTTPVTATVKLLDQYGNPATVTTPATTVTFTLSGNAAPVAPSTLSCTVTTGNTCSITFTDAKAEPVTVHALIGGVDVGGGGVAAKASPQTITFTPGHDVCTDPTATLNGTTFTVAATSSATAPLRLGVPIANGNDTGSDYWTGTLVATDCNGNAVTGASGSMTFTSSDTTNVTVSSITESATTPGTYTVKYTTTKASDAYTASVSVVGVDQNGAAKTGTYGPKAIPFQAGKPDDGCTDPAKQSRIVADKTSLPVGTTSNITVYVVDKYCNPVQDGTPVTISATTTTTPATFVLTPGVGTQTTLGGTVALTLTDTTAGTVNVGAAVTGATIHNSPLAITFTPGDKICTDPSAVLNKTAFTVAATSSAAAPLTVGVPIANGNAATDYWTGTLVATDCNGNAVTGASGSLSFTSSDTTNIKISSITESTTTPGTYTVKYTTTKSSDAYTASVTVVGVDSTGAAKTGTYGPKAIPFQAGVPGPCDPTQHPGAAPWLLSTDKTQTAVGTSAKISAYITDEFCNPVKDGWIVTFTASPSSPAILAPVSGGATVGGTATATLTDTKAETVTVTATAGTPAIPVPNGNTPPDILGVKVKFTTGPDPLSSTFEVSPIVSASDTTHAGWVTVADKDGTDPKYYYVGTVTLVDGTSIHNPITDYDVTKIVVIPSSPDVQVSSVVSNGDGTYTVHMWSKVASATTTARATMDGSPIGAGTQGTVKPIPFKADGPGPCTDPAKTPWSLTASPTSLNINELSTAVAYITDKFCNAVDPGWDVTFTSTLSGKVSAAGTGGTATYTAKTVAGGTATVKVTDSVNETVTLTAVVPGTPATPVPPAAGVQIKFGHGVIDPDHSSISVSPNTAKAGDPVTVSVTLHDAADNAIEDLTSADFAILGTAAGLPNATWVAGQWAYSGNNGTYTRTATSTKPGTFTFGGSVAGVTLNANHPADQATFTPGGVCITPVAGVDAAHTTRFELGVDGSPANGSTADTVKAYAFDCYGNAVSSASFTLTDQTSGALAGKLSPSTFTGATATDGTGMGTASFTTLTMGTYTVSGTFLTAQGPLAPVIGATQNLRFIPGNAAGGTIAIEKRDNIVGDTTFADITTTDSTNNKVGGVSVVLTASSPNVSLNGGGSTYTCTTGPTGSTTEGTCKVSVTSKLVGNYTISATLGTGGTLLTGSPAAVNFATDGIVCIPATDTCTPVDPTHLTHLELTTNGALDNGSAQNMVSLWAYDKYGNALQGKTVVSTPLSSPNLTVVPATTAGSKTSGPTDVNGKATIGYTSTVPGSAQATVTVDGKEIKTGTAASSSPVTMNFAEGQGDPTKSDVVITPNNGTITNVGTPQAVDSYFTITATVRDATNNPVGNATVTFSPDAGLTMTDAVTGAPVTSCQTATAGTAKGTCSVKVTATIAKTYNVGATILDASNAAKAIGGSPVQAPFTAGPICIEPSCTPDPGVAKTKVAMDINGVEPDNNSRDTAQAEAYDKHGNPIQGVQFTATPLNSAPVNVLTIPVTDQYGKTTISFTSGTAGSYQVKVTVPNQANAPTDVPGSPLTVNFGSGKLATLTFTVTPKVTGTPTPLVVGQDPVNTYTVTATAKDALGAAAPNVFVTFTITPAGPTWATTTTCQTSSTGVCSVDVFSTKSGTYSVTAAVGTTPYGGSQPAIWKSDVVCSEAAGCTPDPNTPEAAKTKVWVTTDNQTADGFSHDIATVQANDKWGNPVGGIVVKATALDPTTLETQSGIAGTDPNTGRTTVWFASSVAGPHQVHITIDTDNKEVPGGNPLTVTFVPGNPSATNSVLTTSATSATVGGSVTATATVKDAKGNLVPNVPVTFGVTGSATRTPTSCTTGDGTTGKPLGVCTSVISDNKAETTTVTATIKIGTVDTLITPTTGIDVVFGFGKVDPAHSNLTVSPASQTAGVNVTVTITAHDAQNNAITNLTPSQLSATGTAMGLPDLVVSSFTNMGDGTYTATTTSTVVGTFTLSGTADGMALTQHPTVTFVAGGVCIVPNPGVPAERTTRFERTANDALANNSAKDTIKAWAFDCNGNAVQGATVVLTDTTTTTGLVGKLTQVTAAPVKTGSDGTVLIDFSAGAAGLYTVQGEIDGLRPATAVQQLNFLPGTVNAFNSSMTLDKTSATVNAPITATITTRDAQGSLVGNVSVAMAGTPAGVTFANTCVTSNVANSPEYGTCKVPFTAQLANTYAIAATIGGVAVGGGGDATKASPQNATFKADVVCYVNCTPVDPTHVTHVQVTTDGMLADNTQKNVVTAWAYDTFGNPVKDAKVWSTPLGTTHLTVVAPGTAATPVLTNTQGVATISYTSDLAVTPQQATVLIQDPTATSPTEPKNAAGPSPVTMTFARGTGDPGHSNVTISPSAAATPSIGTPQPVDTPFTITATVHDATNNAVPGVVVTFTPQAGLTLTDAANKVVTSCTTADGTAGTVAGQCSVSANATKMGAYTVAATIPVNGVARAINGSPVTANFTAREICVEADGCTPDPGEPKTSVVMTIDGQPGDGSSHNVATVSAYDKHGNPVKDAVVTATPTTGGLTGLVVQSPIDKTNDAGQSTVWFAAPANGTYVAAFTVGGKVPSGSPLAMQFGKGIGDASKSTFTVTPAVAGQTPPLTVGTGLTSTYKVTATVHDAMNAPAAGALVIFAITPAGPTWTGTPPVSSCTTVTDGTCSVTVYSTVSGPYTVTASLNGKAIEQGKPATWKADGVCTVAAGCEPVDPNTPPEKRTHFVVDVNGQVADGNHFDTVKVYAFDQWGNAVPGASVTSAETVTTGLVVGAATGTNDQGLAVMQYSTLVAGDHKATLKADNLPVADASKTNQIATLTFVAGSASAAKSTFTLNHQTSPAGTPVVGTVTIRDINGNLVPNQQVTFTSDLSSTLTPLTTFTAAGNTTCTTGTGATGAMPLGVCQVSINDLVAETVTVTAATMVGGTLTPLGGNGDATKASPQTVEFTLACLPGIDPGCTYDDNVPNDHRTRVNVTTDNQTAGSGTDVATVWVFDKFGNPAGNEVVTTTPDGSVIKAAPVARTSTTGTDKGKTTASYTVDVKTPVTGTAKVFVNGVELVFIPKTGTPANDPVWNVAANSSPVTLHFLDKTAPLPPAITSPTDGALTKDRPLTISGTGEPGATVTLTDNGQPILGPDNKPLTALVDPTTGKWSVPVPLPDGDHTIKAVQTDPSGNPSDPSAPVTVTVDTQAPGKPVVTTANKDEIAGTVPTPVQPGTTVDILGPDGKPLCSNVAVNATTGAWSCMTPDGTPSGDITVTAKDPANNVSPPATAHLDTVPPLAPENLIGNDKVITGKVPTPIDPCVGTPQKCTTVTVTYPKAGGGTDTVSGTVNPDGTFSIPTPDNAVDGALSAVATDPAGNVSDPGHGTLDRTPPGAPTDLVGNDKVITGKVPTPINDCIPGTPDKCTTVTVTYPKVGGGTGTVDGTVNPDGTFSIPTPKDAIDGPITAVATDPSGNPSQPGVGALDRTPPGAPTDLIGNDKVITGKAAMPLDKCIPGTPEKCNTVTVTYPKADGTKGTVNGTVNPDGTFSIPTPNDAVNGPISAVVTDPSGNPSQPGTGTLDRTTPGAPKDLSGNDKVITGKADTPLKACIPGTPERCNTVTVTYPKADGTKGTVKGTVNPDGTFSIPTPDDAVDGPISAVITDPSGNNSAPGTGTLDRTPPSQPIVNPSNGTEISGSGEPNATVTVTDKDGKPVPGCVNAAVDGNGHFVCTPTTKLNQGDKVNVVVTDKAGNPSQPKELVIGQLGIDVSNPAPKPGDSQTVTGRNFNPGERVCLVVMSDPLNVGCRNADPQGNITITFTIPDNMTIGGHTVTLTGDKSGQVSTTFKVTAKIATGGTSIPASGFPYGLLIGGCVMVLAGLLVGRSRMVRQGR